MKKRASGDKKDMSAFSYDPPPFSLLNTLFYYLGFITVFKQSFYFATWLNMILKKWMKTL